MGGRAKRSHGVCTFFPGYLKLRISVQRGCNTVGLDVNSDSELSNHKILGNTKCPISWMTYTISCRLSVHFCPIYLTTRKRRSLQVIV